MNKEDFENCGKCVFFEATSPPFGNCRRNPPVILEKFVTAHKCDEESIVPGSDSLIDATVFPSICDEGWCGEFKKREGRYALGVA